jgi:hypothetical protein
VMGTANTVIRYLLNVIHNLMLSCDYHVDKLCETNLAAPPVSSYGHCIVFFKQCLVYLFISATSACYLTYTVVLFLPDTFRCT